MKFILGITNTRVLLVKVGLRTGQGIQLMPAQRKPTGHTEQLMQALFPCKTVASQSHLSRQLEMKGWRDLFWDVDYVSFLTSEGSENC